MSANVPTLSTSGWVGEIHDKADRLMAYFFVSDFSQTDAFPITSLAYLVQRYGNDEIAIRKQMESALSKFLLNYFDAVTVKVSTERPSADGTNRLNVTVDVTVTEKSSTYSLGSLIQVVNSKIQQIINLNNNATPAN